MRFCKGLRVGATSIRPEDTLSTRAHLDKSPAGIPSCSLGEGIPATVGAKRNSRTSPSERGFSHQFDTNRQGVMVCCRTMIVTIDGSAGSGKSTAARKLAARLKVAYLDTGAMYRAIVHGALQRGVDLSDGQELLALARSIKLELDCGPTHTRVRVDGHDVSEAIRTMEVSAVASFVAGQQPIRDLLVGQQREIGRSLGSFVTEGRDQGSLVFPNADVKFVIEASLERRAERRRQELSSAGEEVSLAEVMDNLRARDRVDSKQWEPLLASGRVVVIDTTNRTIREVIDLLAREVDRVRPDGDSRGGPGGS